MEDRKLLFNSLRSHKVTFSDKRSFSETRVFEKL